MEKLISTFLGIGTEKYNMNGVLLYMLLLLVLFVLCVIVTHYIRKDENKNTKNVSKDVRTS
jgi:uncharacterized membrane protein YoaK (UPF0700 family)